MLYLQNENYYRATRQRILFYQPYDSRWDFKPSLVPKVRPRCRLSNTRLKGASSLGQLDFAMLKGFNEALWKSPGGASGPLHILR
jgi:hypothetical protein